MLILLLVTLALLACGLLLHPRLRPSPPVPSTATVPNAPARSVSIIIPARNEARNLPTLLASLQRQSPPPAEILVVDDGSTDGTAAVAREFGATVLASAPLPDGWRGKTWACHQGAAAATGDRLLFLDADTWLDPDGLARLLGLAGASPGAFSVGPCHAVRRPYEDLSLFFNLAMTVGTVPQGLFGQVLLVDRASYHRAGGHAAVRGHILENVRLAGQFRAAGIPVHSRPGRGIAAFRMYPDGLRALVSGWTKGFASGAGQTPRPTLFLLVAWMTGLMLAPLAGCLSGDWATWGAVYAAGAVQVWMLGRCVGSFRRLTALLYPVPLVFFFAVFAWSAARSGRTVTWKGRSIRAD